MDQKKLLLTLILGIILVSVMVAFLWLPSNNSSSYLEIKPTNSSSCQDVSEFEELNSSEQKTFEEAVESDDNRIEVTKENYSRVWSENDCIVYQEEFYRVSIIES